MINNFSRIKLISWVYYANKAELTLPNGSQTLKIG